MCRTKLIHRTVWGKTKYLGLWTKLKLSCTKKSVFKLYVRFAEACIVRGDFELWLHMVSTFSQEMSGTDVFSLGIW